MLDDLARRRHDMLLYTLQIALAWAAPKFLEYPEPTADDDGSLLDRPHFYIHVVAPPPNVVADLPTGSVIVRYGLRTVGRSVGTTVAIRAGLPDNLTQLDRRWASVVEKWGRKPA